MSLFINNLNEHCLLFERLSQLDGSISRVIELVSRILCNGGKIMLCGNGGSAADSQHIAAEFTGRFIHDRRPLSALALSTDTSALTCIGNDYSFDDIFYRQVLALGRPGDCLIAISTSGHSRNVIRAVQGSQAIGVATVGLLGGDGGRVKDMCDENIVVPFDITARIQEAHILIGHTICGGVENALGLSHAMEK